MTDLILWGIRDVLNKVEDYFGMPHIMYYDRRKKPVNVQEFMAQRNAANAGTKAIVLPATEAPAPPTPQAAAPAPSATQASACGTAMEMIKRKGRPAGSKNKIAEAAPAPPAQDAPKPSTADVLAALMTKNKATIAAPLSATVEAAKAEAPVPGGAEIRMSLRLDTLEKKIDGFAARFESLAAQINVFSEAERSASSAAAVALTNLGEGMGAVLEALAVLLRGGGETPLVTAIIDEVGAGIRNPTPFEEAILNEARGILAMFTEKTGGEVTPEIKETAVSMMKESRGEFDEEYILSLL